MVKMTVPIAPTAAASVGTAIPIIILPRTETIRINGGSNATPVNFSFALKVIVLLTDGILGPALGSK